MPHRIGHRLPDHRLGVIGQMRFDHRQRSDESDAAARPGPGERLDCGGEPLPESGCPGATAVQVEDRGADLLDHALQIVDGLDEAGGHLGRGGSGNGALQ